MTIRYYVSGTQAALASGRAWLTMPLSHALLGRRADSVITSWPRSGSTWLRTMLTHLLVQDYDSNPEVFNRAIPSTSLLNVLRYWSGGCSGIRSTHWLYQRHVKKALYVVRDPRGSIPSYFRYTTTRIGKQREGGEWTRFYLAGLYGPRWDQHVDSWLSKGKAVLGSNLHVVRYEDLKEDPLRVLADTADFFGIPYTRERLETAERMSSIDVMKKWEEKEVGPLRDKNASFYRGGKVDEWKELFDKCDREKMLRAASRSMEKMGYAIEEV
jgi:hypothetical protein